MITDKKLSRNHQRLRTKKNQERQDNKIMMRKFYKVLKIIPIVEKKKKNWHSTLQTYE